MAAPDRVPDDSPGIKPYTPICLASRHGHSVSVLGYLPGRTFAGVACDRPLHLGCVSGCGLQWVTTCKSPRADLCVPCSARYRRRLRRIVHHGLSRPGRRLYVLTLTAPGVVEHGMWDPGWKRGSRPPCDCHRAPSVDRWNAGASGMWNHLRTLLRREHPSAQFFRATEVQNRGALHYHVPLTLDPDDFLDVLMVQRWAVAAGFGCTLYLDDRPSIGATASYVAKYVTKASGERDAVPWTREVVDMTTGEVETQTRPTYRTWSASRGWGLTMRECKDASRAAAALAATIRAVELIDQADEEATPALATGPPP